MHPTTFPPPDDDILGAYATLIGDIDRRMADLIRRRFPPGLRCRPGCRECCVEFSVLPLEAAMIADFVRLGDRRLSPSPDGCRLLSEDGLCRVYDHRPVICRTQGLALGYIDAENETIEVSACPLNFPEGCALGHEDLLFMDEFNDRLAELNLEYCRRAGLEPDHRIPLSDLL